MSGVDENVDLLDNLPKSRFSINSTFHTNIAKLDKNCSIIPKLTLGNTDISTHPRDRRICCRLSYTTYNDIRKQ
jgi:hypothetical protein